MPAEDYLGVNVFEEDEYATPSANREYYIQLIAKLLAGRRAEKLYTKELSAGANSDLAKATRLAKDMITRYGLDENFTEKISSEMDEILTEAKKYADSILAKHEAELEMLVEELMQKGILSQVELEEIFDESKVSNFLLGEAITESAEIVTK